MRIVTNLIALVCIILTVVLCWTIVGCAISRQCDVADMMPLLPALCLFLGLYACIQAAEMMEITK